MMSNQQQMSAGFNMAITVRFEAETELPNGPYINQLAAQSLEAHVPASTTGDLLKAVVEKYASEVLAKQIADQQKVMEQFNGARAGLHANVKTDATWTIESFSLKGGVLKMDSALSVMGCKSGDVITAACRQSIVRKVAIGFACCTIM